MKKTVLSQIDGFDVPLLPSASEQLHFAKISTTDRPHQIALLKGVEQFFPEQRAEVGHADLEITYLQLGSDYDHTSIDVLQNTARNFSRIAAKYHDIPSVAAKALWYHGWVETDLLGQKSMGKASFQKIIDQYPYQQISLAPVVSWTSIHFPQNLTLSGTDTSPTPLTWAGLAFLELIRNAQSAATSLDHYKALCAHAPTSPIIPATLQVLSARTDLDAETSAAIRAANMPLQAEGKQQLQSGSKK